MPIHHQIEIALPYHVRSADYAILRVQHDPKDPNDIVLWYIPARRTQTGLLSDRAADIKKLSIVFKCNHEYKTSTNPRVLHYPLGRVHNGTGWVIENLRQFETHAFRKLEDLANRPTP